MCIVETRTYTRADGRREVIETPRPCPRATGSRLCNRVEHRNIEQERVVVRRPNPERSSGDHFLVTECRDGRERLYRDVTRSSSKRKSTTTRRGNNSGNRPSMDIPSSASSSSAYSFVEVRPSASSPPPTAPTFPVLERERRPRFGTNDPSRTVAADGTAVYDRPPSLDLPRAAENERHASFAGPERERRPYASSTAASTTDPVVPEPHRRRPDIQIDPSARSPTSSSPTPSSPALNHLPKLSHLRTDSARDVPIPPPQNSPRESFLRQRPETVDRETAAQPSRDHFSYGLDRSADEPSRRRRNAEVDATRETSTERTERHRREAAAALEGTTDGWTRAALLRKAQLEAEIAQMTRERGAAEALRSTRGPAGDGSSERYDSDRSTRRDEADIREPRYDEQSRTSSASSPRTSRRMTFGGDRSGYASGSYTSSPLSTRSPTTTTYGAARGGVTVHQYHYALTADRRESGLSTQGADVVAREQARRVGTTTASLSDALGDLGLEGGDDDFGREGIDDEVEEDWEEGYIRRDRVPRRDFPMGGPEQKGRFAVREDRWQ